jgi:hypothetical protein
VTTKNQKTAELALNFEALFYSFRVDEMALNFGSKFLFLTNKYTTPFQ